MLSSQMPSYMRAIVIVLVIDLLQQVARQFEQSTTCLAPVTDASLMRVFLSGSAFPFFAELV